MCVPMVYGKYICHNSKFILKVRHYVPKSQKMARPHRRPMSKRPDCYELRNMATSDFIKIIIWIIMLNRCVEYRA